MFIPACFQWQVGGKTSHWPVQRDSDLHGGTKGFVPTLWVIRFYGSAFATTCCIKPHACPTLQGLASARNIYARVCRLSHDGTAQS